MKGLLDSIRKLGMVRVAMLVGVTLGIIGAFAWLEIQGPNEGRMAVLASDLDQQSVQQITAELTGRQIPYRQQGGRIFVPDSDLTTARSLLAASGASGDSTTGYEIFDRGNDLAVTDFDQQVKLTRALEGELARTIVSVHGILHARVHLVLPQRQPFSHDRLHAQASVMLTVPGREMLSPEAVQSVVDLVAAGVPGLRPQDVTVVDSNLHLLSQAGDGSDTRSKTVMDESIQHKTEARLAMAVEMMLEQTLGPGHVHAEASIRMNFDKVKETQEKFDPDGSVVRSTQNVTSNSKTTDKTGPVSLQNNLPNADAGAAAAPGTQEGKQQETTNYEISKTVRAIVHDQPQIERITLAVMVDGTDTVGADGKHTWNPRDQAQLDQIAKLVKSAIGFDAKRGDQLDVVSMPFVSTIDAAEATPISRPIRANGDLVTFMQMIAFGVVGFGIIILTARSIFTALNKPTVGLAIAGPATGGLTGEITDTSLPGITSLQPTPLGIGHTAPGNALATAEDDDIVTMSNIQGQLRASSIRKVTQLVDRHPDTTLGIIRGWIATDHG